MATRFVLGLTGTLLFIGVGSAAFAEDRKESRVPERYEITAIRTRAFFHESGRFDERELQDPRLALWNVDIGEGDAGGNIDNTLVLVDVEGPAFTSKVKGAVELLATAEGYPDTRTTVPIHALFTEGYRVTAPFLVHGISCGDLTLLARVKIDEKIVAEKRGVVPFRCGE
jgi:hypothetical protein